MNRVGRGPGAGLAGWRWPMAETMSQNQELLSWANEQPQWQHTNPQGTSKPWILHPSLPARRREKKCRPVTGKHLLSGDVGTGQNIQKGARFRQTRESLPATTHYLGAHLSLASSLRLLCRSASLPTWRPGGGRPARFMTWFRASNTAASHSFPLVYQASPNESKPTRTRRNKTC